MELSSKKIQKRWYDQDPALSLAISLFNNSTEEARALCSTFIINYAKDRGVKIQNNFREIVQYQLKRWYDKEKEVSEAMEYLRMSDMILRKELAMKIIQYLQQIDCE